MNVLGIFMVRSGVLLHLMEHQLHHVLVAWSFLYNILLGSSRYDNSARICSLFSPITLTTCSENLLHEPSFLWEHSTSLKGQLWVEFCRFGVLWSELWSPKGG